MKNIFILIVIFLFTFPLMGCLQEETTTKGCTDPEANNYYKEAKSDDGSCDYEPIPWPDWIDDNFEGSNPMNNSETNNLTGFVVFETPGAPVLSGVTVPFIYFENSLFYLYMCNGTEGHHYSISDDGLNFTSPLRTGIGGCGLNFIKLNDGTYRLYTTTKVTLENGTESLNSTSAVFTNLTDFGPNNRVGDNGTSAQGAGDPCYGFLGTPSVVRLTDNDDSVRLYFSCADPSHMASFTSTEDGINFGKSDGILLHQAIDIEIHDIGDGYRLFYTMMNPQDHPQITPFHPQEIMTAVSDDGLNWEVEGMIANTSTVSDGLGLEITVLADPTAVQLDDGSWRIYFGSASEKTDSHGGIYSLRWNPQ